MGANNVLGGMGRNAYDACAQGGIMSQAKHDVRTVRVEVEVKAIYNFADALMRAITGQRVVRAGWNGKDQWVAAQIPDKGSKMTKPYLYIKTIFNDILPWVPSQDDLFANDWAILPN